MIIDLKKKSIIDWRPEDLIIDKNFFKSYPNT